MSSIDRASDVSLSTCPFCNKADFKRLGNHLPHCKERNGRDYTPFLSQKTLNKKAKSSSCKMFCPRCHKRFARLDTHLRNSAMCKAIPPTPCVELDAAPTQGVGGDAIFSTAADSNSAHAAAGVDPFRTQLLHTPHLIWTLTSRPTLFFHLLRRSGSKQTPTSTPHLSQLLWQLLLLRR